MSVRKEELKRISLTLPMSMYEDFENIRTKIDPDLDKVEAIREAIELWMRDMLNEFLAEGYRSTARDDLKLIEDFDHVDRENW